MLGEKGGEGYLLLALLILNMENFLIR